MGWFMSKKRKRGVVVCPLCGLPENGNYKRLCNCWPIIKTKEKEHDEV